jgi:predicted regulator of Ras-like GTPase activity (Roadblock/LC7/MglB family)
MLGFIKNLLRRAPQPAVDMPPAATVRITGLPSRPFNQSHARFEPRMRSLLPPNGGRKGVEVSLQKILVGLPLELQPRVRQAEVGDLAISIPLEKVLAQLSRGAIKISFGELRRAAPGVFSEESDRDQVLVSLPLGDILTKLNPAMITRRRAQRRVDVPDSVTSPFDDNGQAFETSGAPPEAEFEAPSIHSADPVLASGLARGGTDLAQRLPMVSPTSSGVGGRPHNPTPAPVLPSLPPSMPLRLTPMPAAPPLAPPVGSNSPAIPNSPISTGGGAPPPAESIAHKLPITGPSGPNGPVESLLVPLSALAETWPEAIRREILALQLVEAQVALPAKAIEQAMKQGRINFSWKAIRFWLRPPLPYKVSDLDGTVLELPLKVVAPLFLERQRAASTAKPEIAVDDEIPNLFFGFPQPEAGSAGNVAPAQSPQTNYYIWDECQDTARVHESEVRRGPTPGTKFVAKYATPNEVVSRAASLDGVVGALIALPDGLMVANRLPPDLNGETLAAFLPQIFGKVSQCTKELRMGELNNLHFTVGNVPWKIFRVHAIFFAAFGRAGEGLPTGRLAALAAELDHKPK